MKDKTERNQSHSIGSERVTDSEPGFRFSGSESELKDRIRQIVGNEPVAAFARRCGFSETLVRKYLRGSVPSSDNLAKMADVSGVTVDWLATGRGVRTRSELLALQRQRGPEGLLPSDHPHAKRWAKLIALVEQIDEPDRRDAMLAELFARAQEAADIAALRQEVAALRASSKRA